MNNHDDFIKDSSSILEDIENQLNQALEKKRREVESELEERINREKEEARKKITQIEEELNQDKKTVQDYRVVLSEFDETKKEIKQQIKDHLDKAAEYQSEIDSLTEKTLEELNTISDLNSKLEEAGKNAAEKISGLKKDLEEKYDITAELPDSSPGFSRDFNLDGELEKLKKIKELLDLNGSQADRYQMDEEESSPHIFSFQEEKAEPSEVAEPVEPAEASGPAEVKEHVESMESAEQTEPVETAESTEQTEPAQQAEKTEQAEPAEPTESTERTELTEETVPKEEAESKLSFLNKLKKFTSGKDESYSEITETLEKYRQTEGGEEGKVVYYEHEGKAILDGEQIISVVENNIQESQKLYAELENTESPKDQFFIKQKIIQQQEQVRKFMLNCIRICEQKNCVFPETSREFFNADILKELLERVSMENWSNKDDFERFTVFMGDLTGKYRESIPSPEKYADTLIQGLK